MNLRPSGYEPDELPDCSTPRQKVAMPRGRRATSGIRGFKVCRPGRHVRAPGSVRVLPPALGRPGGDLLSHALRRSTIGAEGFHDRVRDGIGCLTPRHSHQVIQTQGSLIYENQSVFTARRASKRGLPLHANESRIKPIELLVPVSFTHCCASTPGLSTWWSSTALKRDLVSREVSRLDAFSGYPVRT